MRDYIVRPMELGDVEAALRIVRESFEPRLQQFLPLAQKGAAEYVATLLSHAGASPANVYLVSVDVSGRVLGFADFRVVERETAHLSYICVVNDARGRGIATTMIEGFLAQRHAVTHLSLDVFSDNVAALRLYTKLGFVEESSSVWLARPISSSGPPLPVDNLAFAQASLMRYGFCELLVTSAARGSQRFGRIGASVVRAYSSDQFLDDEILFALRGLFGVSTAFAVLPAGLNSGFDAADVVVARSSRLSLAIARDVC